MLGLLMKHFDPVFHKATNGNSDCGLEMRIEVQKQKKTRRFSLFE
jgi:hypothetical protein